MKRENIPVRLVELSQPLVICGVVLHDRIDKATPELRATLPSLESSFIVIERVRVVQGRTERHPDFEPELLPVSTCKRVVPGEDIKPPTK